MSHFLTLKNKRWIIATAEYITSRQRRDDDVSSDDHIRANEREIVKDIDRWVSEL